jgi:stress response protein YsnF
VVDKRVVPKERVRIGKEVVRDQKHVSEPVRKEQIQVEQPDQGR